MLCRIIVQNHCSPGSQKLVTTKHETESVSMKRCMEVLAVFFGILSALYIVWRFAFFFFFFFFKKNFINSWTRRTKNEIKLQWLYFNNAQIRAVCWSSLNNSDSQGHTWVCYHTTSIAASSCSLAAIFNVSSYEHGSLHTIVTGSIKIYSSHHYCDRYVEAKQS